MLILIAESKTMSPCDGTVTMHDYSCHRPPLESGADRVMDLLRNMDAAKLAELTRLSTPMVRRLQEMAYDFPFKGAGGMAIESYTGVVFKALDYHSLDCEAKVRACSRVAIVSSLYGWLRPDDIVKAYRLDFNMKVAPDGLALASYWRADVTRMLLDAVENRGETDVLNLLPSDAARCIEWGRIRRKARVWKAEFKEIISGGGMRTPDAGWLKRLRGSLLRQILEDDIVSAEAMFDMEGNGFVGAGGDAESGTILFHAAR